MKQKPFLAIILFLSTCFLSTSLVAQNLAKLKTYQARGGMPYLSFKVKSGKLVKIAFFGGSITAAKEGWSDQLISRMEEEWPLTSFEVINASIGGTGSDLGAFRVDKDLLPEKPDIVFVEFATNDWKRSPERIKKAMEGIVLKWWINNIESDICFVYTAQEKQLDTLRAGNMPASASAMEEIANFYNIPSIHLGNTIIEKIDGEGWEASGKLTDKTFFADGVHPHGATGHKAYAKTIGELVVKQVNKDRLKPHRVKKTVMENNWSNARILPMKSINFSEGWQTLKDLKRPSVPSSSLLPDEIMKASAGMSINFKFKGAVLGIYDIIGPASGKISISIDGGEPKTYTRFDAWSTYNRLNYLLIEGLERKEHEVVIKILEDKTDKNAILEERGNSMGDPKLFEENTFYLAGILVAE